MSSPIAPVKRRTAPRPLAELVNRTLDPLIARQGFGESTLLTQWETIVGKRVGALCQPARLNWPPRARQKTDGEANRSATQSTQDSAQLPATLVLRVEPGFGLDIQHMSGAIIERINTHLGWRCVARLVIRQEPLHRTAPKPLPPLPDPAARAQAAQATLGVEDEGLRAALIALGENALSANRRG